MEVLPSPLPLPPQSVSLLKIGRKERPLRKRMKRLRKQKILALFWCRSKCNAEGTTKQVKSKSPERSY